MDSLSDEKAKVQSTEQYKLELKDLLLSSKNFIARIQSLLSIFPCPNTFEKKMHFMSN